jgi:hypothetical protein
MKVVRVIYTTTREFAATNQRNISAVAEEVKTLNHPGIKYTCWLMADGKTFMHFDQFVNEEAHLFLQGLASFRKFETDLHASDLEVEPELELLSKVASTEIDF